MVADIKRHIKPKADSTLRNMRKDELIEYIRCLENNYNVAVSFNENQAKYIESLGALPVWIPVTERLPENDGDYLVMKVFGQQRWCDVTSFATDGRKVNTYCFERNWKNVWYFYDSEWGYITVDNVTHWMPLPEPPKEEDHEPET